MVLIPIICKLLYCPSLSPLIYSPSFCAQSRISSLICKQCCEPAYRGCGGASEFRRKFGGGEKIEAFDHFLRFHLWSSIPFCVLHSMATASGTILSLPKPIFSFSRVSDINAHTCTRFKTLVHFGWKHFKPLVDDSGNWPKIKETLWEFLLQWKSKNSVTPLSFVNEKTVDQLPNSF